MGKIANYKDLIVWQKSMNLVEMIYRITSNLPATERWGITSQMRRAVISISSHIAEGYGRQATGEYRHHLSFARGSLLELETQVLLCQRLGYFTKDETNTLLDEVQTISKMLSSLISKIL